MKIEAYGERAILVSLGDEIDEKINMQVYRLGVSSEHEIQGVEYVIPAYSSLIIGFDPDKTDHQQLEEKIKLISGNEFTPPETSIRKLEIPICYHEKFAPDLEEVCRILQLSADEVIHMHSSDAYRVYMIGFLPGFPYLGKLPEKLKCPRKNVPSVKVTAGSVGIAGLQTGIYPCASPGGWQIIGHCPVPLIDGRLKDSFLFRFRDEVRFREIDLQEHQELTARIADNEFQFSDFYD